MSATEENVQQEQTATQTQPPKADAAPPASDGQGGEATTQDRDEKGRFRNPLQPRIDELTRDKHNARREADYWKQRAEAAEQPKTPPKEKPTPDKFDDYGAYVEALTDWKAEEKVKGELGKRDERTAAEKQHETRQTSWVKGVEEAKKAHPDYEQVMSASEVPVAGHVTDLLLDSEHGPRLAYYLDRHPDVADRLNQMSPVQAARELGRIEASFSAPPATATEEPAGETLEQKPASAPAAKPKTTAAPPPAKPAQSGTTTTKSLDKMGMDEYVETRRKQGASWARR